MPVIGMDYYSALSEWRKCRRIRLFAIPNPHTLKPNPHTLKLIQMRHIPQIKTKSPHFKTWCEEMVIFCG